MLAGSSTYRIINLTKFVPILCGVCVFHTYSSGRCVCFQLWYTSGIFLCYLQAHNAHEFCYLQKMLLVLQVVLPVSLA